MTVQEEFQDQNRGPAFIDSRWFPWLDLLLVFVAGLMWYSGLTWQPLLIALLPWAVRVISGQFPFRRTPFDILLLLFLFSAAVGVWASYDQAAAWSKFWLLVGAVLVFYALSGQPQKNHWPLAGILGFFGLIVGSYFLLTHDWHSFPAKFVQLNQLLLRWSDVRPASRLAPLPPNVAASLMAISLPFLIVWTVHNWRQEKRLVSAISVFALILVATMLSATTSRGALMALALAAGLHILISIHQPIARLTNQSQQVILTLLLLAAAVILLFVALVFPGGPVALIDSLPGPSSATSRVELSKQTLALISDFPLTGAGLESFPGLYSHYILVIPYFFLPNGHNIFFDAVLEQGPLGLVSMTIIFLGSFILLIVAPRMVDMVNQSRSDIVLLRWAIAAALIIMLVHGLVEDTVYGSPAILGLFFLPGLALATSLPVDESTAEIVARGSWLAAGTIVMSLALLYFLIFLVSKQSPIALLKANLGTVRMAKVELHGFPNGTWNRYENLAALRPAEELFLQALVNGESRTAHYRLALIALLRQNFDEAIVHLQVADALGQSHRGIRKNLAYSYVWANRVDESMGLLNQIPEAANEMEVYSWWWGTQGRNDLADRADHLTDMLSKPAQ